MKKIIVSIIIIGIFFLSSFVATAQYVVKTHVPLNDYELSTEKMIYKSFSKNEEGFQKENIMTISQNGDVQVLWNQTSNEDDKPLFTSFINEDEIPDVLVNNTALDGITGEIIWTTEKGVICGVGDVNNDGMDEIFSKVDHLGSWPNLYCILYCLSSTDGKIKWEKQFDTSWWILSISIGEVIDGGNNEIVIGTGSTETEDVVYCLNNSGEIIWKYLAGNRVQCTAIRDIDNDSKNEVIAGTGYRYESYIYCFNSL